MKASERLSLPTKTNPEEIRQNLDVGQALFSSSTMPIPNIIEIIYLYDQENSVQSHFLFTLKNIFLRQLRKVEKDGKFQVFNGG